MKLCFITNRFEEALTGGEVYNKALIESAKEAGYTTEIWDRVSLPKLYQNILSMNIYYLFKVITAKKGTTVLFDTDLHARYVIPIVFASLFLNIKIVGMLHHYNYWDKTNKLSFTIHKFLEKVISKRFTYLITNSNYSKNNFKTLTGKDIPTTILYPFIKGELEKEVDYKSSSHEISILHVGTLEKRKNISNVLKALAMLDLDFKYVIAGKAKNNEYLQEIKDEIRSLQLEHKVIFLGRISEEQLDQEYRSANIFLLVSEHEGFGMVYAEAMSYGLPIIGTNTSAVPEVVEHEANGLLCNPFDVNEISKNIAKLSEDENLQNSMSRHNLSRVKNLASEESFKKEAVELFTSLMA